jgi:hypothetical protein
MFRMRIYLALLVAILASATPLWPKCADALIYLRGDIRGDIPSSLTLSAETIPQAGRPSPTATVKDRHFELVVPFDTFLLRDQEGDRCGRTPKSITVIFASGNTELKRITLDLEKDFSRDSQWNYRLREGLTIELSNP